MNKITVAFFFQNIQKMFGILEKMTEIFTKIWAKKKSSQFLYYKGAWPLPSPPPIPPFSYGDFIPYIPYKGFRPQGLDEKQMIAIRVN